MAINSVALDMVIKVAEKVGRPCRILCLGYPDMLVTPEQATKLVGAEAMAGVAYRDDSQAILRWHHLDGALQRVPETRSLFAALGMESDFIDIVASRGFEIVCDLNRPVPAELHGRYDIVYDGGTLEHCFNVGQVMRNILAMTRKGGFIVHVNPLNQTNHGFFNFSPTFYHDWYTQAGHHIVSPIYAMNGPVLAAQVTTLHPTHAIPNVPPRAVVLVAAMKANDAEPDWPVQTKYRVNAGLKA